MRHYLLFGSSASYCRQCYQQFGPGSGSALIFIEEPSNEADQGLRRPLKSFERSWSVQMLMHQLSRRASGKVSCR
jgi:hypothetical protein